jgi:hypothetical protein
MCIATKLPQSRRNRKVETVNPVGQFGRVRGEPPARCDQFFTTTVAPTETRL